MADKDGEATDSKRDAKAERSEMRDLKSHMQQLEKALRESCRPITEIMCTQPQSKGERQASVSSIWRLDKSENVT